MHATQGPKAGTNSCSQLKRVQAESYKKTSKQASKLSRKKKLRGQRKPLSSQIHTQRNPVKASEPHLNSLTCSWINWGLESIVPQQIKATYWIEVHCSCGLATNISQSAGYQVVHRSRLTDVRAEGLTCAIMLGVRVQFQARPCWLSLANSSQNESRFPSATRRCLAGPAIVRKNICCRGMFLGQANYPSEYHHDDTHGTPRWKAHSEIWTVDFYFCCLVSVVG